jgi:hypothetical protein
MLAEMERSKGGRPSENSSQPVTSFESALADVGLNKMAASRWQSIAEMPAEEFEQHIAKTKARNDLAGASNVAPDAVTGSDGKQYPARRRDAGDRFRCKIPYTCQVLAHGGRCHMQQRRYATHVLQMQHLPS